MKILLIQLKRIGDLILTVPALAAVRKNFPRAEISLVVGHGSRELLPAISGLDRAFVAGGGAGDLGCWFALARRKFDYSFDFSRTDRSAFLSGLAHARNRVTYDTVRREPIRHWCYNEFVPSRVRSLHTVDHHLALLAPLRLDEVSTEIHLQLPASADQNADEIIREQNLGDNFFVIHPGSARAEKFWLASRWAEVADAIHARDRVPVVLTGGSSALEQQHTAEIKTHAQHPLIDLSGRLDLLTLAALLKRARILLTIDSAPMHLGAALGTPQLALFGPTNPFHWRPRNGRTIILRAGIPHPLSEFDPRQPAAPMNEISTEQVIDGMQSLLSAAAALSA